MEYLIGLTITMFLSSVFSIWFFKKYDSDWRNMDVDYMGAIVIGSLVSSIIYFIIFLRLNA